MLTHAIPELALSTLQTFVSKQTRANTQNPYKRMRTHMRIPRHQEGQRLTQAGAGESRARPGRLVLFPHHGGKNVLHHLHHVRPPLPDVPPALERQLRMLRARVRVCM